MKELNPKQWLVVGGAVLVLVGILGFVGVIGPTEQDSIFGSTWWFDTTENWAHLLIGIAGLIASAVLPAMAQKYLVVVLGIVALFFGLYSLVSGPEWNFVFPAMLQNPADTILHLAVGVWALWAAFRKHDMMSMGSGM